MGVGHVAKVTINGVEVPKVTSITPGYSFQGQRRNTATGTLRQDSGEQGWKRVWTVATQWVTQLELNAVRNVLEINDFGNVEVWIYGYGVDTITCIIPSEEFRIENMEDFADRVRANFTIYEKG